MKKNSWHYWLAKIGNDNDDIYSGDLTICQYTRKVFWGGTLFLFICFMLLNLVVWIGTALYQIIGAIAGFSALGPASYVLFGVFAFVSFLTGLYFWSEYWKGKSKDLLKAENTSFVAKSYKSYKDKICFKVDFQ